MAKQSREQLGVQNNDYIVIKGLVTFARLDKAVDGDALEKENARRRSQGRIVADKPFRSVTIEQPEIAYGQGTPLASFYGQQIYTTKDGKQAMTFESKSPFAPKFGHLQNGTLVEIQDPMKNPNKGQEIYIKLEAYTPKGFNKMGSSFTQIVYGEGEIDFYEAGGGSLTGFGEALNVPVKPLEQTTTTPVNNNADAFSGQSQAQETQQAPANGFGQATQPQPETQAQTASPFGIQNPEEENAPQGNAFGGSNGQAVDNPFAH